MDTQHAADSHEQPNQEQAVVRALCGAVAVGLVVLLSTTWIISYSFDSTFHYDGWEMLDSGTALIWLEGEPSGALKFWGAGFPELAVIGAAVTLFWHAVRPTVGAAVVAAVGGALAVVGALVFNAISGQEDNASQTGAIWSVALLGVVGLAMPIRWLRIRSKVLA